MPGAWHPKRWWNFCLSEDEKKRNRTFNVHQQYTIWKYWGILLQKSYTKT